MFEKKEYWLLGLILLFGFFLRVYSLGEPALWIDESTSSIASQMILEKGAPIFDSGLLYDRAYLFHYVQAGFMLLGDGDFFARFASVIFGLLTILLAYIIGREYSKTGGLISALFMSVFYLEVFYSRQARFYQLFQLMFFLSLYLLYKSKDNPRWLYASLVSFFITLNVQIAGLVLAPFFILHILIYSKGREKYLSVLPGISLLKRFVGAKNLSSGSVDSSVNYAGKYASYTNSLVYVFILFIPGVIWSFIKKKRLTFLIIVPSLVMLIGIFSLQTFAFRYAYFAVFPLVLYSSLLVSYLYEKYGKIILGMLVILLVVPSSLIFPHTYVNMLTPVDYNYNDDSAPITDYKNIEVGLLEKLRSEESVLVSYFSSNVEWYIGKPDYVLPFSMDGRGEDQISLEVEGVMVDRYSGALMLDKELEDYYVLADDFSVSKLKPSQRERLNKLVEGCEVVHSSRDLRIHYCI